MIKKITGPLAASFFLSIAACFATSSAMAATVEVDTSFGNGADATVSNQCAGCNYGSDESILLRNDGTNGYNRQGYLRFDLSGVIGSIISATFDIGLIYNTPFGSDASRTGFWNIEIYGLVDSNPGNNWGENSITLNNAPSSTPTGTAFESSMQFLGSVSVEFLSEGDRITFSDVTLLNFLNNDTDGLVTLGLRRSNTQRTDSSFVLASAENQTYAAPNLILETDVMAPVPLPAAVWLFGSALFGWAGIARRKRA